MVIPSTNSEQKLYLCSRTLESSVMCVFAGQFSAVSGILTDSLLLRSIVVLSYI